MQGVAALVDRLDVVDPLRRPVVRQLAAEERLLLRQQPARRQPDSQVPLETAADGCFDGLQTRNRRELPAQAGHAVLYGVDLLGLEFLNRNPQRLQHGVHVEIDQHRALKQKRVVGFRAAGAGNFLAVDLDVVARAEIGLEPQHVQGGDDREAQGPKQVHVGDGDVEKGLVAKHFPAELVFVEKNGAAAGVATVDVDTVSAAVVDADFLLNGLVKPHQHAARLELQKPDRVGSAAFSPQLQQGVVQRHVFSRRHGRGVEKPPALHSGITLSSRRVAPAARYRAPRAGSCCA